jgi:hypothetical protein
MAIGITQAEIVTTLAEEVTRAVESTDGSAVEGFLSSFSGTGDDDTLLGDVLHAGPDGSVSLTVAAGNAAPGTVATGDSAADGGSATGFNDSLGGLGGDDLLAGDAARREGEGSVQLTASAGIGSLRSAPSGPDSIGEPGGDDSRLSGFNDTLDGGDGANALIGDVERTGGGGAFSSLNSVRLSVRVGEPQGDASTGLVDGDGGDRNQVAAFNDDLTGGTGDDLAVGEVRRSGGDAAVDLIVEAGGGGASSRGFPGDGGDDNAAEAFNDRFATGGGDDTIVGEVSHTDGAGAVNLVAAAGTTVTTVLGGGSAGDGNRVDAFSDSADAGDGNNTLIGDVLRTGDGAAVRLESLAGSGRPGVGPADGGNDSALRAYGDGLRAGSGEDLAVGDVLRRDGAGDVAVGASLGDGGDGTIVGGALIAARDGGAGGDGGTLNAYNDRIETGDGNDRLIGDVYKTLGDGDATLTASVGTGGDYRAGLPAPDDADAIGGAGGSDNDAAIFNDALDAGGGDDLAVGDFWRTSGTGDVALTAAVGSGGTANGPGGTGGTGGDDNVLSAFNDLIAGGDGADVLVGDVYRILDPGAISLAVEAGADKSGAGGEGNRVRAFSDDISGGEGNDLLVGDVYRQDFPDDVSVSIAGTAGNEIVAFADYLRGGDGDDRLYGDFLDASGDFTPGIGVTGEHSGKERLFADTLEGGRGADSLYGGLGDDLLGETQQILRFVGADQASFSLADAEGDGNDVFYGGSGADRFLVYNLADFSTGVLSYKFSDSDVVADFGIAEGDTISIFAGSARAGAAPWPNEEAFEASLDSDGDGRFGDPGDDPSVLRYVGTGSYRHAEIDISFGGRTVHLDVYGIGDDYLGADDLEYFGPFGEFG